jgi:hypothetical protein
MRKVLLPLIAAIALAFLAGCGDHHHAILVPANPSGGNDAGFGNGSLNGTYVFSVHGLNFRNAANFDVTGNFTADGSGNITGGVRDSFDDAGRHTQNEAITGTYSVNADGRGQAILNGNSGQVIYRFVLESPASGKLFQIGTTSHSVRIDAVGTIQLQSGSPATPAGAYIVRLDGEDFFNVFGAVGRIVFTGPNIAGTLDQNDNGFFSANLVVSGSITLSSGRGTATLTANGFQHRFIVYFVSPTKLELISTDTDFLLQGNAEAQSSFAASESAFAGAAPQQVFALAGFDSFGPRAEVGRMTLDSAGNLTSAIEDIENDFNPSYFAGVALSGSTYNVDANGRWTANLTNSSGAPSPNLVGWQLSPQRSVVLTTSNNIVETGTMRAQTLGLTTASVNGDFAEALSGFEVFNDANLELTANLRFDGLGAMNGTLDSQDDATGLNLDAATSGTYSIDHALGRSTGGNIDASGVSTVIPPGGLPVVYYAVDAKTIYFLPSQAGSIYLGTLIGQAP